MDFMELTDIDYLLSLITRHLALGFIAGGIWGGALGFAVAQKKWWAPSILILLPAAVIFVNTLLPATDSEVYRLFFLGVPVVGVIGFSVWLAR